MIMNRVCPLEWTCNAHADVHNFNAAAEEMKSKSTYLTLANG